MAGSRTREVARVLVQLAGAEVVGVAGFRPKHRDEPLDRELQRAKRVRRALETLGPFYVKVGQMLSTRPDMIPPIMIEELENLHDKVAVAPFADFEPVLAEDLGANWRSMFKQIDTEKPLGAASLAQVYRVTLKNGRDAVVKIQRPGIKTMMLEDMKMLRRVARRVGKMAPDFNAVVDLEAMLSVIFGAMEPELDFTLEAQNMEGAGDACEEFQHLTVPEVIFATPRVLIQSMAPGKSIATVDREEFSEEERKAIGRDLFAFLFQGYFVERMFHADPHPGNIFVAPGEKATIIDWGMVGRLDRRISMIILLVFLNMAQKDGPGVAKAWIELGRATSRADIQAFSNDLSAFVPKVAGASMENLNFGVTLSSLLQFATKRGIQTNPIAAIMGKSFANLEGSVRCLAPELRLIDVFEDEVKGILMNLVQETLSPENAARTAMEQMIAVSTAPEQARTILRDLSNREFVFQVGSFEGKRSRSQDRADQRARAMRRTLLSVAGAAIVYDRTRRLRIQ
jgi:ubiquinone biosynthesis protein